MPSDAPALHQAVIESIEHLRPWMSWIAEEPLSLEARRARIAEWEETWRRGGDVLLGVFVNDAVAGGCGLHRRRGPDTLEIGYWLHPSFVRQGLASAAGELLTEAAFCVRGIDHVEIRHDEANLPSGAVPTRLGYRFVGETVPDEPPTPGAVGIDHIWRLSREEWTARAST